MAWHVGVGLVSIAHSFVLRWGQQACEPALKSIVMTALHTGMRKGELLGLTWDCVDMTHGFIRLKQTKNGKARALPFNETLWELFSRLRSREDVPNQTGMRRGEILNLTWDRIDLKAGLIRLKADDTKTDEARCIPLPSSLTAQLKDLYKLRYLHEPHVFLVKGKSISSMKTAFNAACRRANIEGFRFHDFRHTGVTNMRRAGIDHLTICESRGIKRWRCLSGITAFWRLN